MNDFNSAELFAEAYDSYHKKIFRFFRRDFGIEDSEDLAQQTFMRLWAYLGRVDSVSSCGALIYSIAKSVRADRFRQTLRTLETIPLYDLPKQSAPGDPFAAAELRAQIALLEPRERELLLLCAGGASSSEIGKAFGISASAARSRLQKIRKKLK